MLRRSGNRMARTVFFLLCSLAVVRATNRARANDDFLGSENFLGGTSLPATFSGVPEPDSDNDSNDNLESDEFFLEIDEARDSDHEPGADGRCLLNLEKVEVYPGYEGPFQLAGASFQVVGVEASVAKITRSPGNNGSTAFTISGAVRVIPRRDGVIRIQYELHGGIPNVIAGMHIHDGFECDDIGDLFSSNEPNSWIPVKYRTDFDGNSEGALDIETGNSYHKNIGHVVNFLSPTGQSLGCGKLLPLRGGNLEINYAISSAQTGISIATLSRSSTNHGPTAGTINGTVRMTPSVNGFLLFEYTITGAVPNSVGHLNARLGDSCDNIGPLYSNKVPNAWIPFQYATDENGTSSASFVIDSGFDYDQNVHHAFDVQGPDGKSIACGTLVPMGFGLAIHRGETCKTDVDIRGHFWRPMDSPDPWEDIVYIPDQHGNAIGSFAIKTGFTCSAHDQHAIVIKGEPAENDSDFDSDYDPFEDVRFQVEVEDDTDFRSDMGEGERIACGALFDIDEREDHSDDGYPYERTFLVLGVLVLGFLMIGMTAIYLKYWYLPSKEGSQSLVDPGEGYSTFISPSVASGP